MNKPSITPSAIMVIALAKDRARQLRTELLKLNAALTTAGNGTVAERLAHNALLGILTDLARVTDSLASLTTEELGIALYRPVAMVRQPTIRAGPRCATGKDSP